MKKIAFILSLVFLATGAAWAQTNSLPTSGNVGIGTTNPQAGLHVITTATLADGSIATAILGNAFNHYTYFGSAIGGRIRGSNEGYLVLESYPTGTNNTLYLNTTSNGNISIGNGGGKVIVGSLGVNFSDNSYKLFVQTGIRTEKIKVDLTSQWSDFVFHKEYSLKPLDEVEQFIQSNKHLPDIPSAEQVKANGIDLGEMDAKLLQKIEELTLYIIEQNKTIIEQGKKIAELEKKMN